MDKKRTVQLLLAFGLLLASMGCSRYVISPQLREQAANAPAFSAVIINPDKYIGQTVIWGGIIIDTVNEQGSTTVKVLQTPLDYEQSPRDAEHSQGRFLAKASGYLESEVYQKGKRLTVAGKVSGKQVLPLGETQYTYPVVAVEEIHLWKPGPPYYGPPYYVRPYPYYWGWGWYGPGPYYPWGWGPYFWP